MAEQIVTVKAQLVRFVNDPDNLWYVNLITADGRDLLSEIGFDTEEEAAAALAEWVDFTGAIMRTLH